MSVELCRECGTATGKAGRGEDSLYLGEIGPLCETCFGGAIAAYVPRADYDAVVDKCEAMRAERDALAGQVPTLLKAMDVFLCALSEGDEAIYAEGEFGAERERIEAMIKRFQSESASADVTPRADQDVLRRAAHSMVAAMDEYLVEARPEMATASQINTTPAYRALIEARGAVLRALSCEKPYEGHE